MSPSTPPFRSFLLAVCGAAAQFPPASLPEIALAGRSNAGKSSLLNSLAVAAAPLQEAQAPQPLAKCSATPGRTQTINFYGASAGGQRALDNRRPNHETFRLVDLPGYGYAAAPLAQVLQWQALVRSFLSARPSLAHTLLLIDSKVGAQRNDAVFASGMLQRQLPFSIVLTKSDRLSIANKAAAPTAVSAAILSMLPPAAAAAWGEGPRVFVVSAKSGDGICDLRAAVLQLARASAAATAAAHKTTTSSQTLLASNQALDGPTIHKIESDGRGRHTSRVTSSPWVLNVETLKNGGKSTKLG